MTWHVKLELSPRVFKWDDQMLSWIQSHGPDVIKIDAVWKEQVSK